MKKTNFDNCNISILIAIAYGYSFFVTPHHLSIHLLQRLKFKRTLIETSNINNMVKRLSIFFAGYFVIFTAIYFLAKGDKYTPSSVGKWLMIITPIYLLLFALYNYFKKEENEN